MAEAELLPRPLAERVLRLALRAGAEFAELFAEHRVNRAVSLEDGRVERATAGLDHGVGLRYRKDGSFRYGFSEEISEPALERLVTTMLGGPGAAGPPVPPVPGPGSGPGPGREPAGPPAELPPPARWASMPELAELVVAVDEHARAFHPRVDQVVPLCTDTVQDVVIVNSEGGYARDRRVRVRLRARVIVRGPDGQRAFGVETVAGSTDYDLLPPGTAKQVAESAATQALIMLEAVPAPSGEMPVVLNNGSGGVLAHECCGHGLEADLALGLASPFRDLADAPVASPLVTYVDDATLPGLWGSYGTDDEAVGSRPVTLIESGRLRAFLTDLRTSRQHGRPQTGHGRRVSYRHVPYPRMSNTYLAPGAATAAEVVAATRFGLYAKRLGGGSVEPSTGEFTFTVREAYLIRDGRIAEPVRGATLRGDSLAVLRAIDLVGDDLEFQAASCGKEGQRAWVTVGQPTVRVGSLMVAGER